MTAPTIYTTRTHEALRHAVITLCEAARREPNVPLLRIVPPAPPAHTMLETTPVTVYEAAPGSWLTFTNERGLDDALDLRRPLRVVDERDYAALQTRFDTEMANSRAVCALLAEEAVRHRTPVNTTPLEQDADAPLLRALSKMRERIGWGAVWWSVRGFADGVYMPTVVEGIERLQARLAATAAATCTWRYMDYPESNSDFDGGCGVSWSMHVGGLEENGMHFCPRCGGRIVFVPPEVEPEDDEEGDVQTTLRDPVVERLLTSPYGHDIARDTLGHSVVTLLDGDGPAICTATAPTFREAVTLALDLADAIRATRASS